MNLINGDGQCLPAHQITAELDGQMRFYAIWFVRAFFSTIWFVRNLDTARPWHCVSGVPLWLSS